MFTIQQQKTSTIRTVFVILVLELIFVEKSFSNQYTCGDRNRGRISYITLNSADVNWDEAWRKCNDENFTLPVICNQHEQDAFISHLRANGRYPSAWTSARKIVFKEWKWVDGQSYTSRVLDAGKNEYSTRAYFELGRNHYTAADPRYKRHYLCHYSGSSCMHENDIEVKNGCIRPSIDERLWFDARNQCVGNYNGGDLAKIDDDDLATLGRNRKLNVTRGHWIGLVNNTWRWVRHKAEPADDSGEEIKYTNWARGHPYSHECISIDASNGGWYSEYCTKRKKVICQASFGSDETTSSMPTRSAMTTSAMSSISESPMQRTSDESQVKLYSGAGAGIAIIIICIIVIIFVVKYKRKPHNRNSHVEPNSEKTADTSYQDLDTTRKQANPNQGGVYAELQLHPIYSEVCQRGN